MGVTLSTTSTLAPISLASTLIGFISFAFTLATLLKVLWVNFETLGEAPHEVHSYLTNLRTELLEERANLKAMRKECRRRHRRGGAGEVYRESGVELDEVSLRTMGDTVKQLIRRFEGVERPFLEKGEMGIGEVTHPHKRRRRDGRDGEGSPYYSHSAYASPTEKGGRGASRARAGRDRDAKLPRYGNDHDDNDNSDDNDEDGQKYWAQRTRYADYSLHKRFTWLYKKAEAQQLFQILSRVQTRRIARQVAAIAVCMHEYGRSSMAVEEMMRRVDERMGRFVGVRRVEDG